MPVIYCTLCRYEHAVQGVPPVCCPECKAETKWMTPLSLNLPAVAYKLTRDDRLTLLAMKISPD